MLNEINILKTIDHPNIVKIYEYFEDSKRFYIVQDSIEGGELFDEIIKRGHFSEKDAAVLMK
jgi:calcium-dependent protein kinase